MAPADSMKHDGAKLVLAQVDLSEPAEALVGSAHHILTFRKLEGHVALGIGQSLGDVLDDDGGGVIVLGDVHGVHRDVDVFKDDGGTIHHADHMDRQRIARVRDLFLDRHHWAIILR